MPTIYLYSLSISYIYLWPKDTALGQVWGGELHYFSALRSILVR
ncbi:hypothetical protein NT01EI_2594 [Edwardsiella ictaluri 93-146]|uniref:Uncharacterized protein n=1 Tax=Edwardsiella ictaluri (strain 93-146) TaxID=634503 RepID=C5BG40_EDWI9|nr:hypothetical protein NT01EI_2594 [Edwardsiella ictaluri 93-146]